MDRIKVSFEGMADEVWCEMICKETLADIATIDTPDVVLNITNDYLDGVVVKIKK